MLKELTRDDWLSLLNIPEDIIPKVLLLRGTRNLKANYEKHKLFFKDVIEVCTPNSIFEDVLIGTYKSKTVGYASVYGDAMASEISHLFGILGTSLVIQTGCCGALAGNILAGDIVFATSTHCGEGASQYYISNKSEVEASLELFDLIPNANLSSVPIHKGSVWTTSALLAESAEDLQRWNDQGYIAVDMETASTFAVAEYFGMKRMSLLFAFDSPRHGEHILMTDVEKENRRATGEQNMIDIILSIIEKYKQ